MTHEQRLLEWLSDGSWHCGVEALEDRRYTFSQRASDVNKKEPGRIATRPCQQHTHPMYEYRDTLALMPVQLQLVAS